MQSQLKTEWWGNWRNNNSGDDNSYYEEYYYYYYYDSGDDWGYDYGYDYSNDDNNDDSSGGGWWSNWDWGWDNDDSGSDGNDDTGSGGGVSYDWKSASLPVEDQGDCGSCWAVSGNTVLSAQYHIDQGYPSSKYEFSFAHPVACATGGSTYLYGCDGGDALRMYEWYMDNGTTSKSQYPYTRKMKNGNAGTCNMDSSQTDKGIISNAGAAKNFSDAAARMANGPTVVSFNVNSDVFSFYKSGIVMAYDDNCGTVGEYPNHQMVVVGLDTTGSTPYWVIQNSWGTGWGDGGYFKAEVNDAGGSGTCSMWMDGLQWVET